MAKLTLASFASLQSGSAVTALNNNFAAIITAFENTLSRDGTSPNYMSDNLDMNSNRISNLVPAIGDTEPVRLKEFQDGMDALEVIVQDIASTTQGYLNTVTTIYDDFDDRYLGPKASDPSVDNDGNALLTGALYWNTSTNITKVWTGTQWIGVTDNPHTHLSSEITDFTEAAQDSTGAMVDTTLVYTDDTPQLGRAAISGHISIPLNSNTASLSSFTMAQLDAAVSDGNVSYVGHGHAISDVTGLQGALDAKAPLVSPALSGTPTTPTAAPGTSTTQIASTAFVATAVASGGGYSALTGAAALDLLPVALRGRKALTLDMAGNGYAAFNDGATAAMGALESYASATLTNSTGGLRWTRKRVLASVSADALRLTHDYLGRPLGALFETVFAYLHTRSQPTVAQLSSASNVTDATAPEGWSGNWIGFGDNSVLRYGYLPAQATTTGQEYCNAMMIRMDDGGVPVPGLTAYTGDFLCASSPPPLKPSDGTSGFDITGPFADNVYQVSWYAVSTGASIRPPSPVKYTGQSARGFRIGHRMFGPGRYPPSFMEATGTAPSRAADVLSLPVTGFTADEITLAGEFTAPQPEDTVRTVFCLKNGSDKLEMNFASGSMAPVLKFIVGGVEQFGGTAAALTPGTTYSFFVAASRTDKLLLWKFSSLTADSVGPTAPLTSTSAFTPAALDVGNAGGAAQLSSSIRSLSLIDRAWTAAEGESFTDAGVVAASLSYATASLSADVQLDTSNTFYDGPSVSLAAGTWLLSAQAQYQKTATTASQVTVRLHDGVSAITDQNKYHASLNGITLGFHLSYIVVLASPTTIKLQMATTAGTANALMKAQAPNNGGGNIATILNAVRIN